MVFTAKHVINAAEELVVDSLEGLCASNSNISLDVSNKVIAQKHQDRSKVAIICGGGSGHEPSHAGFVGKGMLTAAVCGSIFASPNSSQVKSAIERVNNERGTLIVVKNYTGDVLCFGLSKEQYLASHPDKEDRVKFVIVGDDVAVGRTQGSIVGRRGLAGTVLVYKIAGALADEGASLAQVYDAADWISNRLVTIGCGLEHCHVPGTGASESTIKSNEIEIGLGIHNEPGYKTLSPVPSRKELIDHLLNLLTSPNDPERSFVPFALDGTDEVILMVNNLGGMSELELGGVARETLAALSAMNIKVRRLLVGAYMTSLNMPGFSLTLLLLPKQGLRTVHPPVEDILRLLDAKPDVPGWSWSQSIEPSVSLASSFGTTALGATQDTTSAPAEDPVAFDNTVKAACESLVSNEPEITRLDSIAGDGDCGTTLKTGAEAILQGIESGHVSGQDVLRSMRFISQVAEVKMGGTSGALYSIFFSALARELSKSKDSTTITSVEWKAALSSSLNTLYGYTRARPPSRTLIDPLAAFEESIRAGDVLSTAVERAIAATDNTANIVAKAGRSAYVEDKHLKGVVDPGALGVKLILQALLQ